MRRLTDDERHLAESVWITYRPFVEAVARKNLNGQADALADCVQNVGLIICRQIHGFRGAGGLRSWIFRVTVHEARRVRRVEGRHGRIVEALTLEPSYQSVPTPFDHLAQSRTVQSVREALATMAPANAEIIRHDLDGLELYIGDGAIRSARYRAKKELRSLIDRPRNGNNESARRTAGSTRTRIPGIFRPGY